jgi:hypothetical protein
MPSSLGLPTLSLVDFEFKKEVLVLDKFFSTAKRTL